MNSSHIPDVLLKNQLGVYARHMPGSAGSLHNSGNLGLVSETVSTTLEQIRCCGSLLNGVTVDEVKAQDIVARYSP